MRILLVNHCHPDMPHICGQRAARFGQALAEAGHHVVLLTETLDRSSITISPKQLHDDLERYLARDSKTVYHLACPPADAPLLEGLRAGTLSAPLRKAVIAWNYFFHSSLFTDWRKGARPFWPVLAQTFKPDVCWGSFGNTEALVIAQSIARMSRCPWVMDVKDPWETFIPKAFQERLANRFSNAAALTTLSAAHGDSAKKFFFRPRTVIHSGIPNSFLEPVLIKPNPEIFHIALVGGVYGTENITTFAKALDRWMKTLTAAEQAQVKFSYAGTDHAQVRKAMVHQLGRCTLNIRAYIPLNEMNTLIRSTHLNAYLRSADALFQHKVFEMLSAGRPVLVFPGETKEAEDIAEQVGGRLYSCAEEDDVVEALKQTWADRGQPNKPLKVKQLAHYTWAAQANRLIEVFEEAQRS